MRRVIENDDGSEVIFTLFRMAGVTDEAYETDAQTIATDLVATPGRVIL